MQRSSPPNSVFVLTTIAMIFGVLIVGGGGGWIIAAVSQSIPYLAFVGVGILGVGILNIVAGIGFLGAKRWSWTLGILASIVTGASGMLEVSTQEGSLSVSVGVNSGGMVWIAFPIIVIYYLTRMDVRAYLSGESVSR